MPQVLPARSRSSNPPAGAFTLTRHANYSLRPTTPPGLPLTWATPPVTYGFPSHRWAELNLVTLLTTTVARRRQSRQVGQPLGGQSWKQLRRRVEVTDHQIKHRSRVGVCGTMVSPTTPAGVTVTPEYAAPHILGKQPLRRVEP